MGTMWWIGIALLAVIVFSILYLVKTIQALVRVAFTVDPSVNFFLQPNTPDPEYLDKLGIDMILQPPYNREQCRGSTFDAIYIGSGISGLTGASLAAQLGKRVLVLEAQERLGGLCSAFEEDGFEYASGLHYVVPCSSFVPLWNKAGGGRIEFQDLSSKGVADTIHLLSGKNKEQLRSFDVPIDAERARWALITAFGAGRPDVVSQLNDYFDDVICCEKEDNFLILVKMLVPRILRRTAEWIMGTFFGMRVFRLRSYTIQEYLQMRFPGTDPIQSQLRGLFARWSHIAGRVDEVPASLGLMVAGASLKGKQYPVGGPNSIVEAMVRTILKHGGEAYCNAPVKQILLDDDDVAIGVEMRNGDRIFAESVVSCCGIANTYGKLLPQRVRPVGFEAYAKGSYHMILAFLGFDVPYEELDIPENDIWVVRDDSNEVLTDLYKASSIAEIPSPTPLAYLANPNRVHPSAEGMSGLILMVPTVPEHFERWTTTKIKQRGSEYLEAKEAAVRDTLELLFRLYPKLRDHLVHESLASNLSCRHWTNCPTGETYGATANRQRLYEMYDACIARTGGVKGGLIVSGVDQLNSGGIIAGLCSGCLSAMSVTKNKWLFSQLIAAGSHLKKRRQKMTQSL